MRKEELLWVGCRIIGLCLISYAILQVPSLVIAIDIMIQGNPFSISAQVPGMGFSEKSASLGGTVLFQTSLQILFPFLAGLGFWKNLAAAVIRPIR